MHEALVVVMMVLTPMAGTTSKTWNGWTYAGQYPNKAACEAMAVKIRDTKPESGAFIAHVCSDEPIKK